MKFNCDWKKEWHDHFCLFPVRIAEGDCRWLETVERRLVTTRYDVYSWQYYEYRTK